MNSFVRPLRQSIKRGGTVEKECKKYFAFYVLFPFGLWMQCGIQVLPGYANRMPKSSMEQRETPMWLYIKQDIHTHIYVCVSRVCVCVVSFGTHLCENPLEPDWREPNFLLSSRRNRKTRRRRSRRRRSDSSGSQSRRLS